MTARFSRVRTWLDGVRGPLVLGLSNQMVGSGVSFLFGLYLLRVLSVEDYGTYTIGMAAVLFFAGISNSLFLVQMVVRTPEKAPAERPAYAARMLMLVVAFAALLTGLGLVGAYAGLWKRLAGATAGGLVLPVLFSASGYMARDFMVRHAFNFRVERWALEINMAMGLALAALLVAALRWRPLDVTGALILYGSAMWLAALFGVARAGLPLRRYSLVKLQQDLREALVGGRWVFLSNVLHFLRNHAHTVIVAATIGAAGVGRLNAARLLVMPAMLLTPVAAQLAMPRLADLREGEDGPRRALRAGGLVTAALIGVAGAYGFVVLSAYPWLVRWVLGEQYVGVRTLVILWALTVCLFAARDGLGMLTMVLMKFRALAVVDGASASVALLVTYVVAVTLGIDWVLVGLMAGAALGALLLLQELRRNARLDSRLDSMASAREPAGVE